MPMKPGGPLLACQQGGVPGHSHVSSVGTGVVVPGVWGYGWVVEQWCLPVVRVRDLYLPCFTVFSGIFGKFSKFMILVSFFWFSPCQWWCPFLVFSVSVCQFSRKAALNAGLLCHFVKTGKTVKQWYFRVCKTVVFPGM